MPIHPTSQTIPLLPAIEEGQNGVCCGHLTFEMIIYSFQNYKCHRAHKAEKADVAKPHVSIASLLPSEEAIRVGTTLTCVLVTVPVTTTTFEDLVNAVSKTA